MTDITTRLVDHCSSIDADAIPDDALQAAKVQVLDSLGVGLAGINAAGIPELVKINAAWGGKAESTVLGSSLALPAPNAAQINASMIHAFDFDDGHPEALMHPGVISVSTALAVAESVGRVSGKDFLAAIAIGTDLICRLGIAVHSEVPKSVTGWHFTSIFGFIAGAAVAGRLLQLSPEAMRNAMGIAYHQSAGNLQCARDGALSKRLGPGFAAKGGITAALLAARGVTGASGWLDGEAGIFRQYFGNPCNEELLMSGLGTRFEGTNVGTKRYPCCGIVHPFIDATLELVDRDSINTDDIEGIEVHHGGGTRFLVEPVAAKREPRSIVDAQFSVQWVVAAALTQRKVTLENFTESGIADKRIRKLSRLIDAVLVEDMTRADGLEAGRVEVHLSGGERKFASAENRMNAGGDRISFGECAAKFYECVEFSGLEYSADQLSRLVSAVGELENIPDAAELAVLLQPRELAKNCGSSLASAGD